MNDMLDDISFWRVCLYDLYETKYDIGLYMIFHQIYPI